MSKRNITAFLQDILSEAERIEDFTKGMDYKRFVDDKKTQYAIIRSLEIIGEASKKMPVNLRQKYQDIDWRKISGLRDILIHEYFGINLIVLWDIVQKKIPDLLIRIQEVMKEESKNG